MKELLSQEERKIVDLLKEYNQLKYQDLKVYFGYENDSDYFLRMLRGLARKGYIRSVQGIGLLYWRYDIPIVNISPTQYRKAKKIVDSYVKQLEDNQNKTITKTIEAEIHNVNEGNLNPIHEYKLNHYTSNPRLLFALGTYFYEFHNIKRSDSRELTVGQLPPISIGDFMGISNIGNKTRILLEKLCDRVGIELLP